MSARWTRSTSVLTQHPWSAAPVAPSPSMLIPSAPACVLTSAHPDSHQTFLCFPWNAYGKLPEWICFNPHNSPVSPGADTLRGWGN